MENNDPILQLISKVGELTGLVKGLDQKMDDIKKETDRKIGRDTCENIVNTTMSHHIETMHRKSSTPPAPVLNLSPKQKKILVGALTTAATAVAAYFTAKFGG